MSLFDDLNNSLKKIHQETDWQDIMRIEDLTQIVPSGKIDDQIDELRSIKESLDRRVLIAEQQLNQTADQVSALVRQAEASERQLNSMQRQSETSEKQLETMQRQVAAAEARAKEASELARSMQRQTEIALEIAQSSKSLAEIAKNESDRAREEAISLDKNAAFSRRISVISVIIAGISVLLTIVNLLWSA